MTTSLKNEGEITTDDVVAALKDIAEADPDLIEYILTYYPPELMIHISPKLCQRLEASKKSLSHQGPIDLSGSLSSS